MKKLSVVKIGGNVIDNPAALSDFLEKFSKLDGLKVLIHGGGKIATEISSKLGVETKMQQGRRITDKDTLDVVTMVYGGLINKNIVAKLQPLGCNAIGLSGADGNTVVATRRVSQSVDWGFVGDVEPSRIDTTALCALLEAGITPVFCALTHDGCGSMLNTNADTMASSLAVALSREYEVSLIYCFEMEGVMRDVNDSDSIVGLITPEVFDTLLNDGVVKDGMIPKLQNALGAVEAGVERVVIKHARNLCCEAGTIIKSQ